MTNLLSPRQHAAEVKTLGAPRQYPDGVSIERAGFRLLAEGDLPVVGQVAAGYSRGRLRVGIVSKVGRKNATIRYTTEGGVRDARKTFESYKSDSRRSITDLVRARFTRDAEKSFAYYSDPAGNLPDWASGETRVRLLEERTVDYAARIAGRDQATYVAEHVAEHVARLEERIAKAQGIVAAGVEACVVITSKSVPFAELYVEALAGQSFGRSDAEVEEEIAAARDELELEEALEECARLVTAPLTADEVEARRVAEIVAEIEETVEIPVSAETLAARPAPRQSCRGHLESGSSYTVGTLPNGETRPYLSEILADGRRFHYCRDCATERGIGIDLPLRAGVAAVLLEDFEVGAPLEVPTEPLAEVLLEIPQDRSFDLHDGGRLVEALKAGRALELAEAVLDPTAFVEIGAVVAHVLTVDELLAHRDGQPREFHDGRCSRCGSEISYRFVKAHAGYGYGHLDGTPAQSSCSRVTADELKAGLRAALAIALDEEPAR